MSVAAADTAAAAPLLEALARALGVDEPLELAEPPLRRGRATLYVVRVGGGRPRVVVKQALPAPQQQPDLPAGITPGAQYAALVRLEEHFAAVAEEMRTARPIVLMRELQAFAMEYVAGRQLNRLIAPAALTSPDSLLAGLERAGRFLSRLHEVERPLPMVVDARAQAQATLALSEELGRRGLALPPAVAEALAAVPAGGLPANAVRLHGDFAPVNLILADDGALVGIDVSLVETGPPETDLARFLTVFGSDRLFIAGSGAGPIERLRARGKSALRAAYEGPIGAPLVLELARADQLVRRWLRRHDAASDRVFARARREGIDRHFPRLLVERARAIGELL